MTITFITGANKGLGYETARQLIALGHTVYMGSRDEARGVAAADELGGFFIPIDVSDDSSVARAAATLRERAGRLDVLINNAGITGPQISLTDFSAKDALGVFNTNAVSVVRVTNALLPLLESSDAPRIVNVSSGLGSIASTRNPDRIEYHTPPLVYSATKSAVTMLTVQYARALPHMRINAADPGYSATDLNGHQGTQTVSEGVVSIVRLAAGGDETGTFQDSKGIAAL